jgi:gamma-glutamyltranspeptidase
MPMRVDYQSKFSEEVIEGLQKRGHDTKDVGTAGSVAGAIARLDDGRLMTKADYRTAGGVDGF